MKTITMPQAANPLTSFMRQPKIYIRLPSQGAYWKKGSLDISENGEYPVFSMTAKDELTFKTPDALMNGQAVVDVIQSCIPNIKDAWNTPNLDLDLILLAIRVATYGSELEMTHTVPGTEESVTHQIDIRSLMDQIQHNTIWEEVVPIDDNLTCYIKPLTYKHITTTSLTTFETQRIMQTVNDESLSDEKKLEIFNHSFKIMTGVTLDLMIDSIQAIQTPTVVVEDRAFIKEFLENADKDVFKKVQDQVNLMKKTAGIQPLLITSEPEHVALGAPATYELPISIDNSSFFGNGS